MKKQKVSWVSRRVDIKNILPTPVNYKIRNALGVERLKESLKQFGLAGNVVCNWGKRFGDVSKLILVDGNSRLEEAKLNGERKLWVSLPDRVLTDKEFKDMSALFDFAKAGEVDVERITNDLGSAKDFLKKWNIEPPFEKLGNKVAIDPLKYKAPEQPPVGITDVKMVQLFFSDKQEAEFRKLEQQFMKRFKTKNTTDTVFTIFKKFKL